MTKLEGNTIVVSGDEYRIIVNFGNLLVLKRNDVLTLYFENIGILLTTKQSLLDRHVKEEEGKLIFCEKKFNITSYGGTECGIRKILTLVNNTPVNFYIDNKKDTIVKVE